MPLDGIVPVTYVQSAQVETIAGMRRQVRDRDNWSKATPSLQRQSLARTLWSLFPLAESGIVVFMIPVATRSPAKQCPNRITEQSEKKNRRRIEAEQK